VDDRGEMVERGLRDRIGASHRGSGILLP
jgi:hypothetical protein